MDIIFKAAAVALITAAGALLIKKTNPENAFMLGVIGAVIILGASAVMLSALKDTFYEVINETGLSAAIFTPIIKCTIIAVTVKIISSICKDSGQSGIASSVEFLGSAAAMYSALPLLSTVLKTIGDLI
ncbi:MAG: stage III sporulation AC/AD family protein [Bacillota bacterium]|nr:stage III sporulation AC/AD family protein [Bacillota bacterium]